MSYSIGRGFGTTAAAAHDRLHAAEEARIRARTIYDEGRRLWDAGNYAAAAEQYRQATLLAQEHGLNDAALSSMYGTALSYARADMVDQAVFWYQYLADNLPPGERRTEALAYIAAARVPAAAPAPVSPSTSSASPPETGKPEESRTQYSEDADRGKTPAQIARDAPPPPARMEDPLPDRSSSLPIIIGAGVGIVALGALGWFLYSRAKRPKPNRRRRRR